MHVLRAEKGYIIVGQETDGTVTPEDVGLGWTIGRTKPDFVGKRSLARAEMRRPDRRQLVGLLPRGSHAPEEGAQLIEHAASREPLGHVTSSYPDGTLGRPIALGLLAGGRARIGGSVLALGATGEPMALDVVSPVFHDPEGKRLHG
jgi:sarcosine oxidase subunit alpha